MDMRFSSVETAEKLQCLANLPKSKFSHLNIKKGGILLCNFARLIFAGRFLDERIWFK